MNQQKHLPNSLDEWLKDWVVEHKNIDYQEPIRKIDYRYMLEKIYEN